MLCLAFGALNWQPDGSSINSESGGCKVSDAMYLPFLCTALSNILQSCFCDLPITFLAMLTILESVFLLFTLKLSYQAVMLNDKMLSTRLLYAISSKCWLMAKLFSFLNNRQWLASLKMFPICSHSNHSLIESQSIRYLHSSGFLMQGFVSCHA